jgi:hypothetical protein
MPQLVGTATEQRLNAQAHRYQCRIARENTQHRSHQLVQEHVLRPRPASCPPARRVRRRLRQAAPVETSPDGENDSDAEADCSWEVPFSPSDDDPTAPVQRKRDTQARTYQTQQNWSKIHEPLTRSFIASHQLRRDAARQQLGAQHAATCAAVTDPTRLRGCTCSEPDQRLLEPIFTAEATVIYATGAAALQLPVFQCKGYALAHTRCDMAQGSRSRKC